LTPLVFDPFGFLFPVIALGISTLFEGYQWSIEALYGYGLVLIGNYVVLIKAAVVKIAKCA
jgi:hypothetical protein